jgi:hypothetical protein
MTPLVLAALASLPCVFWTQGIESRAALEAAGIRRLCVAPDQAEVWRAAGFSVTPLTTAELAAREALPVPGVTPRAGIASPTRTPWIVASGWRFTRQPKARFVYDLPSGKAALAAAEAFAYGADVVLKVDPADLESLGDMLKFLEGVPEAGLPPIADLAVVDDGSPVSGEVINLLTRRNLLLQVVTAPSARFKINVAVGTADYPIAEAADPSAFAQKIRRQLTDEQRTLRVYGSEVVICRLTGDGKQVRLHLLNYGGREIEGLRIRLRGTYAQGEAAIAGTGRLPLTDFVAADGATEFSVPRIASYAVIDLKTVR